MDGPSSELITLETDSIVANVTQLGTDHALNQDAAWSAVDHAKGRLVACAAVFDGHGVMGEVASAAACAALSTLMRCAASRTEWFEQPENELARLLASLHDAVLQAHAPNKLPVPYAHEHGRYELSYELAEDLTSFVVHGGGGGEFFEPIDFGCTATVGVLLLDGQRRRVVCGNLGDSPAVLCGTTPGGDPYSTELSVLHAASEKPEQQRISMLHWNVDASPVSFDKKYLNCLAGPLEGQSLEPTRGLGHPFWAPLGFSQEPHIRLLDVEQQGLSVLVVMSDGVSDVLSALEIEQVVLEELNAVGGGGENAGPAAENAGAQPVEQFSARRVASRLVERAVAAVDGGFHDDATAAVILAHAASTALSSAAPPAAASSTAEAEANEEDATAAFGRASIAPVVAAVSASPAAAAPRPPSRKASPARSARGKPRASSPQPQKAHSQRPRRARTARAASPHAAQKDVQKG